MHQMQNNCTLIVHLVLSGICERRMVLQLKVQKYLFLSDRQRFMADNIHMTPERKPCPGVAFAEKG